MLRYSAAEATARLTGPAAGLELGALDHPLLVVDLDAGGPGGSGGVGAAALAVIRALPCVSVAMATEPSTVPGAAGAFDVLLCPEPAPRPWVRGSEAELRHLATQVARRPLAATALVQLLRMGPHLGTEDALVAESAVYSMLQSGPEFETWLAGRPRREARSATVEPVRLARTGSVLDLTLNRPEVRNAYNSAMRDALVEALALALYDTTIESIRLTGSGPAFCSGGDLQEFGTAPDPATAHALRTAHSVPRLLAACSDRVVACVHGACVGAGAELAAFAGRVEAASDTFFELPELGMGLVPGAGGTVSITGRVGSHRAAYLALSGVRLTAPAALEWGLVDVVT